MATDWITTGEAAELSGYHIYYLRELIRAGKIAAVKKGYAWWVDRRSLLIFIKTAMKSEDKRRGGRRHSPI